MLDLPVDFDELTKAGSMMGSGGMIVMDENTCMVDMARYFSTSSQEESCGKCVPCREGLRQMRRDTRPISARAGARMVTLSSLSPVPGDNRRRFMRSRQHRAQSGFTTLRYFRDEYEAHIKDKKCPAGVCKALIQYRVVEEKCKKCGACKKVCPADAVTGELKELHTINTLKCIKCGACFEACKFDAVSIE